MTAIRTIAVVGDGIAGWSAAAALKRRVPGVSVAVVPVAGLQPGLVDRIGMAAPSIGDFHRDIGLDEADIVRRTGASFRLGTRFRTADGAGYFHGYGAVGAAIDGVPFASLWPRDGRALPFNAYAPAAALAHVGRFVPAGAGILGGYAHGLQLDPPVYRRFIEAYARHLAVAVTAAGLAGVDIEDGRVAALRLGDGGRLVADLYIDATDAEARLIGALDDGWQDWSAWLPGGTLHSASGPADPAMPPCDTAEAVADGWRLTTYLPARTDTLHWRTDISGLRTGRRGRAWIGNVVAIGEAHMVAGPLAGAPLHALHTQIDRLIASLPGRDFAAVELANYNRETNDEADRLRDFLILHHRTTPPLPPLLADTLALFRERGRLPLRDGEGFDRPVWHAVLFGQGIVPRRTDPLASRIDPARARADMAAFRSRLDRAVAAAPAHRDHLTGLNR